MGAWLSDTPSEQDAALNAKLQARAVQELEYHATPYREVRAVYAGRDDLGRKWVRADIMSADGELCHQVQIGGGHPNVLLDKALGMYARRVRAPAPVAVPYLAAIRDAITYLTDVRDCLDRDDAVAARERLAKAFDTLEDAERVA